MVFHKVITIKEMSSDLRISQSPIIYRNKNELDSPILNSFSNLVRFHLGTVAFGSLLIACLQLVRTILHFIEVIKIVSCVPFFGNDVLSALNAANNTECK